MSKNCVSISGFWGERCGTKSVDPGHPMTHVDTLALVRRAELFRGLDEAVIEIIAAAGSRRAITRGTPLIQQGAPAAALYFVLDGRLKVVHGTPQGEQVTLRFMGPEELVGCAAVFRQMPYPASATAITDTLVLGWHAAQVMDWVAHYPVLARNALHMMGGRVEEMLHRVRELASDSVEKRLANVLLRLLRDAGRPAMGGIEVPFAVSRQDLAEMTGATLYTVSRILSAWKRDRILSGGRQRILIRDLERVQAIT
jgi:CRP-like cAMP-binding protein